MLNLIMPSTKCDKRFRDLPKDHVYKRNHALWKKVVQMGDEKIRPDIIDSYYTQKLLFGLS